MVVSDSEPRQKSKYLKDDKSQENTNETKKDLLSDYKTESSTNI